MKFMYGRRDWITASRGQENCYLLTNGLGGYSSAAMTGADTRSDHALLMACIKPPDCRYNMVHRLEEQLEGQGMSVHLSSQEYADQEKKEEGFHYLSSFQFEDYPKWVFHVNGVEVVKELAMKQGENVTAVKYTIDNRTSGCVSLKVTPYLQFTPKGSGVEYGQKFSIQEFSEEAFFGQKFPVETVRSFLVQCTGQGSGPAGVAAVDTAKEGMPVDAADDRPMLYFYTNGRVQQFEQRLIEGLFYAHDACDGRFSVGNAYANHHIMLDVEGRSQNTLEICYYVPPVQDADSIRSAGRVLQDAVSYRQELVRISGLKHDAAAVLVKSADQFAAQRGQTGGKTLLAGFPHFGDWGRDTMIALAGCCLTTGQTETAKSILRTFAAYCKDGLMPNLFPDGGRSPQYNTADASLLYIHAVYLYMQKTQDMDFLHEIWPVMADIIRWYCNGTAYGIHMDTDGLLMAGEGLDQVTWMDVRIGDILPTPRHGKPVEINAYWYNALCIMAQYEKMAAGTDDFGNVHADNEAADFNYAQMAQKTKESFCGKFWNEKKGCLKDVLSGTDADEQIRCNQIWAVSMPFSILEEAQERQVVDTVFEKLYTPYGLRTLEMADAQFHASYGGPQAERDLAYHQGTVWVFPLGAYYLAYLKTRGYSKEAVQKVRNQLELLESALWEGCIGQLPEIYDGAAPSFSRGCFAQAWSVGEILRVYEALEA